MRAFKLLSLVVTYLCGASLFLAASESDKPVTVRVASYNVEFSKSATAEQIGEMFKPYQLDIIGFDEAPDGDWTARAGKVLGMPYSFVGKISSANHKDKYKTILSRTPLEGTEEYKFSAGRGWNPASAVRATTRIEGISIAFYSLHICKSGATDGHAYSLATRVLPKEKTERVIVVGDFNNKIGDAAMNTIEAAGYRSTWDDLKIDVSKEFTYNAQNPKKNLGVIDHIFYNTLAGPKSTDGGIIELEKPLSDHKPIWAEITFPRKLEDKVSVDKKPAPTPTEKVELRVMSYNIYRGGIMRKQPLSQTVKVIHEAKADIVGIQEMRSPKGDTAEELAKLLGWNLYVGRRHKCIVTRHEIVDRLDGGIKVKLPSGQHAYIFTLHLASNPYQPYQLLSIQPKWHKHKDTPFIKTETEAIAAAKEARGSEVATLLLQIDSLPDKQVPVFVVGDFNEPSHFDWTEKAAKSGRHPIKVAYPTSMAMAKAGFKDSWRMIYPDEMKKPGFTWTPIMEADDLTTHHDRIDFVYFKGKGVEVIDTKIVGESLENADIVITPYPSDHRAVVAKFTLPGQPG